MNKTRRALLKGMLATAAMGSLPKWSFGASIAAARPLALLSTGSALDALFLSGAERAAAEAGRTIQVTRLVAKGGIVDLAGVREFLRVHRGMRAIGLMDDAGYVLFSEAARDAGAALLLEGRHGQYASGASRHELRGAAGLDAAAETLATGMARGNSSFALSALPLAGGSPVRAQGWPAPGFDSYRIGSDVPLSLHLSGVSVESACTAFDLPPENAGRLAGGGGCADAVAVDEPWSALLGYALCRPAGSATGQSGGGAQVFLRGEEVLRPNRKLASVVSFVVDL